MVPTLSSPKELLHRIEELSLQLEEAEETLRAIGSGEVDAFVVSGGEESRVFTLKGAEHPYRVLVETMNEGAASLTADGTILYCNNSLAEMLQMPLESLIGTQLASHIAPSDRLFFAARLHNPDGNSERDEISLITCRGNVVPVLISYCAFEVSGGQGLSVLITDLTQQKHNEEFMAAERLARSIIDQAGEVIIVCDEGGRIIRASKLAHELCAENPLLKSFDDLFRLRITETGHMVSLLPSASSELYINVEVEFTHSDNRLSYFLLNLSPLKGDKGEIIGYIATLTDITVRKEFKEKLLVLNAYLEQRVEQRTQELQEAQSQYLHAEKLSAIGKLSASIAHEFNNPLQGVMSILKGLKKRAILEEEDKELLDAAIAESERMKNLIRSLQDFSRPSPGKKVVMDVHASIDSLLLLYKNDFKRKKIDTVLNYAEQLPPILAIPDQIKQVFLNLLNNAADACLQSGGVITISTWREDKIIAIAIKDNGVGIKPDQMDLIFQPFYTTKPEVKGTGLGLSVCHGIAHSHQGEILVESQPGEGSTFIVRLPVSGENDINPEVFSVALSKRLSE